MAGVVVIWEVFPEVVLAGQCDFGMKRWTKGRGEKGKGTGDRGQGRENFIGEETSMTKATEALGWYEGGWSQGPHSK